MICIGGGGGGVAAAISGFEGLGLLEQAAMKPPSVITSVHFISEDVIYFPLVTRSHKRHFN